MSNKLKLTTIKLETKDGKEIELSLAEAKDLHDQLHELFGTTRGGQEVRMVGVVCNACADLPPNADVTGLAPAKEVNHE